MLHAGLRFEDDLPGIKLDT